MTPRSRGRLLMVIENEGVPEDRRVWDECRTLAAAGWEVVVVCPQADDAEQPASEVLEGIEIHRFPLARRRAARSATPASTARRCGVSRRLGAAAAAPSARSTSSTPATRPTSSTSRSAGLAARGARLIFDHHDLAPELYRARFGRGGLGYRVLRAIERRAHAARRRRDLLERVLPAARDRARGRRRPRTCSWSATAPTSTASSRSSRTRSCAADAATCSPTSGSWGRRTGSTTRSAPSPRCASCATTTGTRSSSATARSSTRCRRSPPSSGSRRCVEFAGWRGDDDIRRILSTADVCLAPDPPSPLNDVSTMVKVPEYMAMGRPIASYDLPETRVSRRPRGGVRRVGRSREPRALRPRAARGPGAAARDGRAGLERVVELSWQRSSASLLAAYEHAVNGGPERRRRLQGRWRHAV